MGTKKNIKPPRTLYNAASAALSEALKSLEQWKVRTWNAEQEIHDLKEQAERNDRLNDEVLGHVLFDNDVLLGHANALLRANAIQYEELRDLREIKQKYSDLLATKVCQVVNEPTLPPPTSSKPHWTDYKVSFTPSARSGPGQTEAQKPNPMKKHYARIAIALLLGVVLGLGAVVYRQGQVIKLQRRVIVDMYEFILSGCHEPPQPQTQAHR